MSKDVNEPADEALVQRARSGDRGAFVEFATRWWPVVSRVAWSMLGNGSQAVAVTEEVLGMVLLSPARPDIPIRLWLYRLALWLAIIRSRSQLCATRPDSRLFEALGGLDNKDRAAFVLRDVERLSVGDAAAVLDVSPAELRAQAHRARLHLVRVLGDESGALDLGIDPRLLSA